MSAASMYVLWVEAALWGGGNLAAAVVGSCAVKFLFTPHPASSAPSKQHDAHTPVTHVVLLRWPAAAAAPHAGGPTTPSSPSTHPQRPCQVGTRTKINHRGGCGRLPLQMCPQFACSTAETCMHLVPQHGSACMGFTLHAGAHRCMRPGNMRVSYTHTSHHLPLGTGSCGGL